MGPDFGDFMRQIPTFPIVLFCGSGLLLMVSIALIVRARIIKAQERFVTPDRTPDYAYTPSNQMSSASFNQTGDLPDLDLLIGTTPAQTPQPAPVQAPQRPANKGMYIVNLSDGGSTEAVEVMTIMRDVVNGGLLIQMGDKTYRDLASDETFKTGFLKVMRELGPVVKNAPASSAAIPSPAEPPVDETDSQGISSPPSVREHMNNPEQAAPPSRPYTPPQTSGGSVPSTLPRYSLENQPLPTPQKKGLFGRGKLDLPPVPELNIAGAIETYLQHKLLITQTFPGRSIHVHPAPDGGVAIEVDRQFYESVGDVREQDVREFLQQTIQEWQQSNT